MLLLVTIVLVVIGTISLVIGFVQSALLPIYISIACSVLAAVVLLIFSRMTAKSQKVVTSGAGPAPLDLGRSRDDRTEREPAFVGTGLVGASDGGETFAPEPAPAPEPRFGALEDEDDFDAADDFPIERYDSRRVGEILPLLAELDLDELDIVREHEEQGKSRATVLARIDQLIDQLEAEDRHEAASRFDDDAGGDAGFRAGADLGPAEDPTAVDQGSAFEAGAPAPPPPPPTQALSVAALPDDDGYFPIEDYDDLRASEILPLLPELDDDELEMVREREQSGAARASVLQRIDELAAPAAGMAPPPPPPPEPEPEPAPASVVSEVPASTSTRRASTKRAPAAKAPAKKAAAPAAPRGRKASAAAAPAPVVPAAPVKKAPVKKAPSVKKAAARKAAPPAATTVTKIAPVKKAPAKATTKATTKATPAGKVAAGRAAAATKGGGTASAKAAKVAKAPRKSTRG